MYDTWYLGQQTKIKEGIVFIPGTMYQETRHKRNKTIVLKAFRRHARLFFLLNANGPQTVFFYYCADGMHTSVIYVVYIHLVLRTTEC